VGAYNANVSARAPQKFITSIYRYVSVPRRTSTGKHVAEIFAVNDFHRIKQFVNRNIRIRDIHKRQTSFTQPGLDMRLFFIGLVGRSIVMDSSEVRHVRRVQIQEASYASAEAISDLTERRYVPIQLTVELH